MIILRNKMFARPKNNIEVAENEAEGVGMEIIKISMMYMTGPKNTGVGDQNIDHWLREMVENRYFADILRAKTLPLLFLFARNEDTPDSNRTLRDAANGVFDEKTSFGDEFIKDCIIKAEKEHKYTKYLENDRLQDNRNKVSEFRRLFKYIALSFTHQISPSTTNYWDYEVESKNVDYRLSSKVKISKEEGRKIIAACIINYLENTVDPSTISYVLYDLAS